MFTEPVETTTIFTEASQSVSEVVNSNSCVHGSSGLFSQGSDKNCVCSPHFRHEHYIT